MEKYILWRDSKGTVWENCFDEKKTELRILAKSKKQAFKIAYDNIAYDKYRGWGILPPAKKWAGEPEDEVNAPTVAIDNSPHLDVPTCRDCPFCGRPLEGD